MSMQTISSLNTAGRIEIPHRDARSVHVALGTAIRVVSGNVWLTQEGDSRDYSIPEGVTFCADRGGRAVLSAIDGMSVVIIRHADAQRSGCVPGTATIDSIAQVSRRARASQAAYFASLFTRLLARLIKSDRKHSAAEPARIQRA